MIARIKDWKVYLMRRYLCWLLGHVEETIPASRRSFLAFCKHCYRPIRWIIK